jgi:hypothetical protein
VKSLIVLFAKPLSHWLYTYIVCSKIFYIDIAYIVLFMNTVFYVYMLGLIWCNADVNDDYTLMK